MRRAIIILLVVAFAATGCANGLLGSGTKIAVKNSQSKKINMVNAIEELTNVYGEPTVHYRAYKDANGDAHVIKDLYYTSDDGRTIVTVTVVDDEAKQIITTVK